MSYVYIVMYEREWKTPEIMGVCATLEKARELAMTRVNDFNLKPRKNYDGHLIEDHWQTEYGEYQVYIVQREILY